MQHAVSVCGQQPAGGVSDGRGQIFERYQHNKLYHKHIPAGRRLDRKSAGRPKNTRMIHVAGILPFPPDINHQSGV